jgi:hypothetical protein
LASLFCAYLKKEKLATKTFFVGISVKKASVRTALSVANYSNTITDVLNKEQSVQVSDTTEAL